MPDLVSYLVVVPVLGVLIFVHELGHFMAAKAVGIGVSRFSIGLGPITPLRFQRGETEYVISWVPFGGYVKMASQEELEQLEALEGGKVETPFPPEKYFESKSLAARILVISAGVIMNALFAWVVFSWIAYDYGSQVDPTTRISRVAAAEALPAAASALAALPIGADVARVNGQEIGSWSDLMNQITDPSSEQLRFEFSDGTGPVVVEVPGGDIESRTQIARSLVPLWDARIGFRSSGGPAGTAGLREGDLVLTVGGEPVDSWDDMVRQVEAGANQELIFQIERDGSRLDIPVTPVAETVRDPETGENRKVGRIGINPYRVRVHYGPVQALVQGWRDTVSNVSMVLYALKAMVVGTASVRDVGGPVLIAQVSAQAAQIGLEAVLLLTALLSVNLAILNLLPIPVLDGGHLVFLGLEGLRGGRPVSKEWRQRLTMIGFYFLMAFMLFVVVNDLLR